MTAQQPATVNVPGELRRLAVKVEKLGAGGYTHNPEELIDRKLRIIARLEELASFLDGGASN
jgi:hypothetical protein